MPWLAEQMQTHIRGCKSYFRLAPLRYSKIWIRGYVTDSGLSSLSTGAREQLSIVASAVSGVPMSWPYLWREARGIGGDTAKLG